MRFWLLVLALLPVACLLDHEPRKGRTFTIDCRDRNLQGQDSLHDTDFTCDATGGD